MNASTNGSSASNIIAVEFDPNKSCLEDIDNNHEGVDVNSVYSIEQVSLTGHGVNISSRTPVTASANMMGSRKNWSYMYS